MNRSKTIALLIALITGTLFGVGCESVIAKHVVADSLPVRLSAATTNNTQAEAWLMTAQLLNNRLNPTPTREPIDTIVGALIGLAAAASGYWSRHHAEKSIDRRSGP